MFTAIILMCTMGNDCYTITNQYGFYQTEMECKNAIKELILSPNFAIEYMNAADGVVFNVKDARCINWDGKQT